MGMKKSLPAAFSTSFSCDLENFRYFNFKLQLLHVGAIYAEVMWQWCLTLWLVGVKGKLHV